MKQVATTRQQQILK